MPALALRSRVHSRRLDDGRKLGLVRAKIGVTSMLSLTFRLELDRVFGERVGSNAFPLENLSLRSGACVLDRDVAAASRIVTRVRAGASPSATELEARTTNAARAARSVAKAF